MEELFSLVFSRRLCHYVAAVLSVALVTNLSMPFLTGSSFQNLIPYSEFDGGFIHYLKLFPLSQYERAFERNDMRRISFYNNKFLDYLMKYVIMEPVVPVNNNCNHPPPLKKIDQFDCLAYPDALTGVRRTTPAKVAHVVSMGFDVDALEIHLRQVYDLVDYFFIMEARRTHAGSNKKIIIWEHVRNQSRFKIFEDKVVLLALNDSDSMPNDRNSEPGKEFSLETHQEIRRWEMFLKWNEEHNNYFSDSDIIGFGHNDELPSRFNIQLLKYCEIEGSVDIGTWFPVGLFYQAWSTDFPVPGHRFTYGEPTFWPVFLAKLHRPFPSNRKGKSGRFLLGGIHMSDIRYAPFIITKIHTCTECGPNRDLIKQLLHFVKKGDEAIYELEQFFGSVRTGFIRHRIYNITDVRDEVKDIVHIPWFLDCNRDRYPYWEQGHDSRL